MRQTLLALILAAVILPATAAESLTPGKTVNAVLKASDRSNDRGGRSHDYTLQLKQDQIVLVTAKSEDFDAVVLVFGPDGDHLAENDDHESGSTNAALIMTAPQTGSYTVRVNSLPMGDGHVGAYSVRAIVFSED